MDLLHVGIMLIISLAIAYVIASLVWKGIEWVFKTIIIVVLTIAITALLFFVLR